MHHSETTAVQPQPTLFKNPNFMILWLGQMVSQLGNSFFTYALIIWVVRTAGAPALAGIMMVASIPGIVLGPVAGTLVDSLDRKKIIVFSDLFRGGLMLVAAWLMYQEAFLLSHIYALLIMFNIIQPLFGSAISAVLPSLVHEEQLVRANSMRQASSSGASLVGPALAATLLALLGGVEKAIPFFFFLNGISFILSACSEMFLSIPHLKRTITGKKEAFGLFWTQLIGGFKYVWKSSLIARVMIALAVVNFFMVPLFQVVVPGFIIDAWAEGEMWLGFIQSGAAGGFLLASVLMAFLKQASLAKLVTIGVSTMGITVSLIGVSMALPVYIPISIFIPGISIILFALLMGAAASVTTIAVSTIMQKVVPAEKRGRIFAFMNTFIQGLIPLSLGISGFMAALIPLFIQPIVGGLVLFACSLILVKTKQLK